MPRPPADAASALCEGGIRREEQEAVLQRGGLVVGLVVGPDDDRVAGGGAPSPQRHCLFGHFRVCRHLNIVAGHGGALVEAGRGLTRQMGRSHWACPTLRRDLQRVGGGTEGYLHSPPSPEVAYGPSATWTCRGARGRPKQQRALAGQQGKQRAKHLSRICNGFIRQQSSGRKTAGRDGAVPGSGRGCEGLENQRVQVGPSGVEA
ncbi:UNVERIFIED_CONTAM: hypothetical protein K2H54_074726 [Gekko kuhli]